MSKEKLFFILAGANGVGKTTVSKEFLKEYKSLIFLNADETAKDLNPKDLNSVRIRAGKEVLKKLDALIDSGKSIVIESTLSGNFLIKVIQKARKLKYKIIIFYAFVDTPEICIERIKARVKKGGHFVPAEDVVRRFYRSIENFNKVYKHSADTWILYYNMQNGLVVAKYANSSIEVLDDAKYHSFLTRK
jgi:predicted ABC-type ATPase